MKRAIPISVIATLLIQSCVIYQKTPVVLEEAVEHGRVMVITDSGQGYEFRKIMKSDDQLYLGVNKGDTLNLSNELISEVYLNNKALTFLASAGLSYLAISVVAATISIAAGFSGN